MAASKAIRGITVEIGGDTTALGKSLLDVGDKTAALQSELGEVTRLLKFNPDNVVALTQKQTVLNDVIKESEEELRLLEEAQKVLNERFEKGEVGADKMRNFQREVIRTQSKLDGYKADLKTVENALSGVGDETEDSVSALDKLTSNIEEQTAELTGLKEEYTNVVLEQGKSSDEAKELSDRMKKLNDSLKKSKKQLSSAESEADDLADALDDAGDAAKDSNGGFSVMKGALADLTSNAIQGAVSAIGEFIGSLLELDEATEEYRTMQAKLEGAAKTFGYTSEFATDKYKQFYKYLGDDQMATNAITNLMGIGTSTENLSGMVDAAIGVWASYGDSIPIESLTESINETIKVGQVTGSVADALNWASLEALDYDAAFKGHPKTMKEFKRQVKAGASAEDALNSAMRYCYNEAEREQVIRQLLNELYGESKTVYDETAKSVLDANEAEQELKDTQAQLGEAVAPVNTAMTDLKNQALQAILPLVQSLADGFMNLYNWLKEHPTAMAIVTAVVIALAAAFGVLATALAIQALINGVTKAISFLNLTLLSNPIVLIIALIAGLVAAFIYLWNNCEGFRQFFVDAWEAIQNAASVCCEALKTFFTETVPQAWDGFLTWLGGFIEMIGLWFSELPGNIWTWLQDVIDKIGQWGSSIWASASSWVVRLYNSVVTWFRLLPGRIWTWLSDIINKIAQWGSNIWNSAKSYASKLVNSVVSYFRQLPTRIWTWLSNALNRVTTWGSNLVERGKTAATNFLNNVVSFFRRLPSRIWTWLTNAASKVVSWGSDLAEKGKQAAQDLFDKVTEKIGELPGKVLSLGSDIVTGLWNGINNMGEWIGGKIKGFGEGVLSSLKNFFGIKSPSTLFRDEVGKWIPPGIAVGITANADDAIRSVEGLSEDMINAATIDRKLNHTFNANMPGGATLADVMATLKDYGERLIAASNHPIMLDTGVLVGETINQIDAGLAGIQTLKARGV